MKWKLVVAILCSPAVLAQNARVLTLDEAIAIGKENSRLLRISEARVDAAGAKANEAGASLLPSLKLEGGYKRLSDVPPFQVSLPLPGVRGPITISPTVLDNYNLKASVQEPLFTGFRLRNTARAAETLAEASRLDHRNDEQDLQLSITTAYWTLYLAFQTSNFVAENVVRLRNYQTDTDNLMKAGLATRNDHLKIAVQLSNAELARIDAANDVQVAIMNLNNVLGLPLETKISLASTPASALRSDSAAAPRPADSLFADALGTRSDLQAMESRVQAAVSSLAAARGNWWPQLFLNGAYYYSRPNVRYQPTLDAFKTSWEVGVQLQFDLWNWGATAAQVQQAEAAVVQNTEQYAQMKENVSLEVRRSRLAVLRGEDKVAVAQLGVDQADENLRTTGDKFRNGISTSSDLLDADVALLQAKTNYTGALVELELARARLARAVGGQGGRLVNGER